jgi:hypothetical protein
MKQRFHEAGFAAAAVSNQSDRSDILRTVFRHGIPPWKSLERAFEYRRGRVRTARKRSVAKDLRNIPKAEVRRILVRIQTLRDDPTLKNSRHKSVTMRIYEQPG